MEFKILILIIDKLWKNENKFYMFLNTIFKMIKIFFIYIIVLKKSPKKN